ncbi:MAG: nucleoside triphosphate pyrophosphohydrolase family protein [Candidatus Nealsonbacteria bacterium DGGOD1a]|jgi:NTP pyrophosphatase (non-canonical NTP hydrolase)|nr:MAG: nucleoside triphosphate pyrophosphohydrolase family protein [Candidatus Nealsonbacteria bacterium DGGOD1a]
MEFNEYQKIARTTAMYSGAGNNFAYPALGLCGEAGEVAEKIKRIVRDGRKEATAEESKEISKELGDVLWYIANLAAEFGLDLDMIARENLEKLKSRKERGVLHGSGDNR